MALRKGFTLVELLVAATMLSVLLVGVGAHLRGGLSVWRRTTALTEALQRERILWDQLSRDLANAIRYADGRDDEYALRPPVFGQTELAWVAAGPGADGSERLRVVRYACDAVEERQALWRTRRDIGSARAGTEPVHDLLVPDCRRFDVRYGYEDEAAPGGIRWDPTWRMTDALPQLLEVTVELDSGRALTQRLAMPAGVFEPLGEGEG